jgi:hypothetical protein
MGKAGKRSAKKRTGEKKATAPTSDASGASSSRKRRPSDRTISTIAAGAALAQVGLAIHGAMVPAHVAVLSPALHRGQRAVAPIGHWQLVADEPNIWVWFEAPDRPTRLVCYRLDNDRYLFVDGITAQLTISRKVFDRAVAFAASHRPPSPPTPHGVVIAMTAQDETTWQTDTVQMLDVESVVVALDGPSRELVRSVVFGKNTDLTTPFPTETKVVRLIVDTTGIRLDEATYVRNQGPVIHLPIEPSLTQITIGPAH